jgi:hypothetical protein
MALKENLTTEDVMTTESEFTEQSIDPREMLTKSK